MARNMTFDAIKGFLMVLVLTGHSVGEGPVREVIYYFHMPLFLALTGYFVKDHLLRQSVMDIFRKYRYRMILPFLIAFVAYTAAYIWIPAAADGEMGVKKLASSVLNPYYHLWYIPAVLLFVAYTKILTAFKSELVCLAGLLISAVVTALYYVYGDELASLSWARYIGDARFYAYYSYFLLGHILCRRAIPSWLTNASCIALPFLIMISVFVDFPAVASAAHVLADASLILLAVVFARNMHSTLALLSRIGQVSLPIYLWHLFPVLILKNIFPADERGVAFYLLAAACCSLVTLLCIWGEGRRKISDILFYGAAPARA